MMPAGQGSGLRVVVATWAGSDSALKTSVVKVSPTTFSQSRNFAW